GASSEYLNPKVRPCALSVCVRVVVTLITGASMFVFAPCIATNDGHTASPGERTNGGQGATGMDSVRVDLVTARDIRESAFGFDRDGESRSNRHAGLDQSAICLDAVRRYVFSRRDTSSEF